MVGYKNFIKNEELLKKFQEQSKIYGVIFIVLGMLGIIFPVFLSLTTAYFLAWILLFSGISIGIHTFKTEKKNWLGWLKAVLFVVTAIFTFLNPTPTVAALGIILATYLLIDAMLSFSLAYRQKGEKGWWLIAMNGIFSLVLAAIFLKGWPFNSLLLVGVYVGISLFFDGVILISMADNSANSKVEAVESEQQSENNEKGESK